MNEKGFTIVEVMVVMVIMAILTGVGAATMENTRNGAYLNHTADRVQNGIREQFINAISVKEEAAGAATECNGKVPKVRALRLPLNDTAFSKFQVISFCEDDTDNTITKITSSEVDIAKELGFGRPLTISVTPTSAGASYLYLGFSSPNGKFNAFYGSSLLPTSSDWSYNTKNYSYTPIGAASGINSWNIVFSYNNQSSRTLTVTKEGNVY